MELNSNNLTENEFKNCIALLKKTGLLISKHRFKTSLDKLPVSTFLKAAHREPRIYEILPAALLHFPQYFSGKIPKEISELWKPNCRKRKFFGISVKKCLFWIKYPDAKSHFESW